MAGRLSTLEKINAFKTTLTAVGDYDPYLKLALPIISRLYVCLVADSENSTEASICLLQLEMIITELEIKLRKQESYYSVIQQVSFKVVNN